MTDRKRVNLEAAARKHFGIRGFRPGQEEVVRSVLRGEDTLVVMSTGAGKSLCYQLPALFLPGTTVVVSPLISLMKDQVDKLEARGLDAALVNSTLTEREEEATIEEIERSANEFVFTTPERLSDPEFLATLTRGDVDLFVVDEAHCISEWGHDFRPAFLEIGTAIEALGHPCVLALTATATSEVIDDVKKQLGRPSMRVVNMGVFRKNLTYEVVRVTNEVEKRRELARLVGEIGGPGIVYCATVKNVEAVTDLLRDSGVDAARYHGRLGKRERTESQDRFMSGETRVVVATNAFGMGIDKPDIRFVVHCDMPGSLEAYYQESGRAGRDGRPSRCVLLFDADDRRTHLFFLGGKFPKRDHVHAVYDALERLGADERPARLAIVQESADGVAKTKVRVVLKEMKELGLVRELRGARYRLVRRAGREEIDRLTAEFEERVVAEREKIERVVAYAQSARCRWTAIGAYFGDEVEGETCDACDNCLSPPELPAEPARLAIPKFSRLKP